MTKTTTNYRMFGVAAIVAILSVSMITIALSQSAIAAPANKSAFGGEGVAVIPNDNQWHTITYGEIKTSTPSDLLVAHNQECTILTGLNLDNKNQDLTSAIREDVRLKVTDEDGSNVRYINPVPLYAEGTEGEPGDTAVTMCGRAYNINTNILQTIFELCAFHGEDGPDRDGDGVPDGVCSEEEPYFESFIRTKAAHGWDWVVPNLGSGVHIITVQALLTYGLEGLDTENDEANAKGKKSADNTPCAEEDTRCVDTVLEIGKRSLIVTEEKFASSVVANTGD